MTNSDVEPGEEYYMDEQHYQHLEIFADEAAEFLTEEIGNENKGTRKAHSLMEKFESLENIFTHLQMSELSMYDELHSFMVELHEKFEELMKELEREEELRLHILKEDREYDKELKTEMKHHEWKAVWKTAAHIEKEKKVLKTDIKELKKIYVGFKELSTLITNNTHLLIKGEKVAALKHLDEEVKELKNLVKYFNSMFRFITFYKEFFKHTIKKEFFFFFH